MNKRTVITVIVILTVNMATLPAPALAQGKNISQLNDEIAQAQRDVSKANEIMVDWFRHQLGLAYAHRGDYYLDKINTIKH